MSRASSGTSRALALSTYFLSGVLSINLSQFLGAPLKLFDEDWYNAWIAFTKQSFGLLTMKLTQSFSPTKVIVCGDASVRGQMRQRADGTLELDFPKRLILIGNHQIYTDWLYLWWIAYCNKMHGYLYIILKESLKSIPILGWGMQLSQFIFLKRNWEQDKPHMAQALQRLNKSSDPMWLLLFPEGTNLAPDTRRRSTAWANKTGVPDCRHVLLPRSTGLHFCLNQLQGTVDYLYDCTIAYEGVPRGQYAQDIFTLKAGYLEGKPPKSVSMYWRRFAIRDIPIHDEKVFGLWLTARWREKDMLIENFHRFGRFPMDTGTSKTPQGKSLRGCGRLTVEIRSSQWYEFLQIFAPMGVLAMVLYIFYGALPQKVWKSINNEVIDTSTKEIQQLAHKAKNTKGVSGTFDLDSFFDKNKQDDTFRQMGMDLAKRLQTPEAKSIINRASLVQQWLENPQKFVSDNLEVELTAPTPQKSNFLDQLRAEEQRRVNGVHHGTFWQDMEATTAKRANKTKGTVTNTSSAAVAKNNNDVQKSRPPTAKSQPSKIEVKNGSFWSDLKKEETARQSSVSKQSSTPATTATVPPSKNSPSKAGKPITKPTTTPNHKSTPTARKQSGRNTDTGPVKLRSNPQKKPG